MTFTPEQQAWLDARVASGEFASPEEAIAHLIDIAIAEDEDDLAWAKPLVDEALASVERGDVITLEEHRARNAARLAALRGR